MRDRELAPALLIALACACGDGVGRPIVSGEATDSSESGSGGVLAASGRDGSAEPVAGGSGGSASETTAGTGGTPLLDGNAGAAAGEPGPLGGMGGIPTSGAGGVGGPFDMEYGRPPRAGEAGSRTGPDWSEEDPASAVPESPRCASVVEWDRWSAEAERELFRILNFARESGLDCRPEGAGPLPPLVMRPELRCSARLHSRAMRERDLLVQELDGVGPEERMREAGASFAVAGEIIAEELEMPEGGPPYQAVAEKLAAGEADCDTLADPRFDAVGIGFFQGMWTLDFTGP